MIPLQIFEKHPTADAYRVGGFYSPYALVSTDKRFSQAEMMAEYWYFDMADFDCPAEPDDLTDDEWEALNMRYIEARRALDRFAALPHAHESDYE